MLPGAPRTPSNWAFGFAHGPMHAMFWLPNRSIWVAPIITWRLPAHTMSNVRPKGAHASTTLGTSAGAPTGIGSPSCSASPSVMTRSGSNVSTASRAPIVGIVPIGLARTAPSPRHASAHATAHTSASVAPFAPPFAPALMAATPITRR